MADDLVWIEHRVSAHLMSKRELHQSLKKDGRKALPTHRHHGSKNNFGEAPSIKIAPPLQNSPRTRLDHLGLEDTYSLARAPLILRVELLPQVG